MIETMCRITCAVPEFLAREFFEHLQSDGRVHLILADKPAADAAAAGRLLALRSKLLAALETISSVPVSEQKTVPPEADVLQNDAEQILDASLIEVIPELEKSVEVFQKDASEVLKNHEALVSEKKLLEMILSQTDKTSFVSSADKRALLWWVPENLWPAAQRHIEKQITTGHAQYRLHPTAKEGQVLAELLVPVQAAAETEKILRSIGAHPWMPPQRYQAADFSDSIVLMKKRLDEIERQLDAEQSKLAKMRRQWQPRQEAFFFLIDRKISQYEALSRCRRIGPSVVAEGWIPLRQFSDFKAKLEEKFGGRIAVYSRLPEEDEYPVVPTALSHVKAFAPFEIFLKLVQPPAYGSSDPTALIGIFFPFFAGCIIGDAGYGLLMLILMLWLRRRSKRRIFRDAAYVLISMCVWSLFWGCAFGEFFGDTGHRLFGIEPLWVERSQAVMPVLIFSVALGLAHVLIGLLVGFFRGVRSRHKRHALEKLGEILVILALVVVLTAVRALLPSGAFPAGIALLITGLILLCAGGGIGGLIESMSSFGHILSYVRIGAIGLSSAILAVAASKFVDVLGVSVLGIFIALSIHALNFVLAFAESGLHAARLHYVEFMGNFYEAHGTAYNPFRYRRNLPWKKDS